MQGKIKYKSYEFSEEQAKRIQKALIKLGFKWGSSGISIQFTTRHIFADCRDMHLSYVDKKDIEFYKNQRSYKDITDSLKEVLNVS